MHPSVTAFFLRRRNRLSSRQRTLDPSDAGNIIGRYPTSTFISKLLERSAYDQLNVYLQQHSLIPEQQSVYRRSVPIWPILCWWDIKPYSINQPLRSWWTVHDYSMTATESWPDLDSRRVFLIPRSWRSKAKLRQTRLNWVVRARF